VGSERQGMVEVGEKRCGRDSERLNCGDWLKESAGAIERWKEVGRRVGGER